MRTRMMCSSFLLICVFAMSEQCSCPIPYTQRIICYDPIVVEAKIESFSDDDYDTYYQISVTKFYNGKGEYDTLTNKTTLKTPKQSSACGPVILKVGSSYILSVAVYAVYGNIMHHNLCELQVDAASATSTLLEGIAGKYQENCDCEIPNMYQPPQSGPRTKNQCGGFPRSCHSYHTICARDGNGQCNWQNC
ncbi:metalloproteinase inhibitor 2-like isoform X3 [Mytilus californianus]|uniref:metalloproteinase inhibitor 2-like isoform X3 n=1 Tax=Mytilus californianus TaxID=6549 RepID=UPI0022483839|nr:metalloproteinase inhibitor 2-like isoform X3 [Mytilus californianus]